MGKHLSGWVRVWIVGAVLWWAGGAWWLVETHQPTYDQVVLRDESGNPLIKPEAKARKYAAEVEKWNVRASEPPPADENASPLEQAIAENAKSDYSLRNWLATSAAEAPFTDMDYVTMSVENWSEWLNSLYFVVFLPFAGGVALAVLVLVGGWVVRGFRGQSASA